MPEIHIPLPTPYGNYILHGKGEIRNGDEGILWSVCDLNTNWHEMPFDFENNIMMDWVKEDYNKVRVANGEEPLD